MLESYYSKNTKFTDDRIRLRRQNMGTFGALIYNSTDDLLPPGFEPGLRG